MAIINKPSDFFNTKLYNGTGSSQSITGVGFQPDFVWIKERNGTNEHNLFDSVRGTTKRLESSTTAAEQTSSTTLTAFGSDGFTVGNNGGTGQSGGNYVGWNWKAGTSFTNDASATGIGSIDSAGSANQDAGFSICTYTNTNTNTIKHGLDVVPDVLIAKTRGVSGSWFLGSEKMLGSWNKKLNLNDTGAVATETRPFYPGSAAPTSTVFSSDQSVFGAGGSATETMVAYCFAEKQGYSKFGSYIGNGNANGVFVYLGFKPAFVMIKKTDGSENWKIWDNKRPGFNDLNYQINVNNSDAESNSSNNRLDLLSNGFKLRGSGDTFNSSGGNYIYMAFAENPFVAGNFNVATAR